MKLFSKIIGEILKQFYNIFIFKSLFIKATVNNIFNIINKHEQTKLFKTVYFLMIVIVVFCIVIGLFASNYHIRGIAIPITGGFLIYELLTSILILLIFYDWEEYYKEQKNERFVDNFTNYFEIDILKEKKCFAVFTILNVFLIILDSTSKNFVLKFFSPCVELSIYIIVHASFNRLISIDKTLVFLVLVIMSLKTCFKSFLSSRDITVVFNITRYDIFYLITSTILFILSLYVKFVRDILVNIILSIFYSIILSLFISTIYYGTDDFFNRLKISLLDDNEEDFTIFDDKIEIENIFIGCFILYLITIFFTWRLFWKKKTIVKMDY
ncbi:hypothetical protein HERIO_513 [Hepatospora eriocheir]|uniref:Uncharacterized protein n=1 Tax=Hepatospora eriocheir TaxID=1081669 RepID=A0A1X0QCZ8_9MICR|nr:hypothetical protein HERIO_513 [Hepatospora eriocheir]